MPHADSTLDLSQLAADALNEALRSRGRVTVLLIGKTGVGKSTLVNAMFQGRLAATGQGRPVTTGVREITKEGVPLTLLDTRGLEVGTGAASDSHDALLGLVAERARREDPAEHVHVAWLCLAEDGRRVEEAESTLATRLHEAGVPVLAVITKARADGGFRAEVGRYVPVARNFIRVRALPERLDDGHRLPPMGLTDLAEATAQVVPEGQRTALAAAQRVHLGLKASRARLAVRQSAAAAVAAGAVPLAFSDAALLVPIQVTMLARVTVAFGLQLDAGFLATFAGSGATTVGGRLLVGSLLKVLPGAGSVAGGIICAGTAGALTTALGEAYIATLRALLAANPDRVPTPEEVAAAFKNRLDD